MKNRDHLDEMQFLCSKFEDTKNPDFKRGMEQRIESVYLIRQA